jgi:hypothetical protein
MVPRPESGQKNAAFKSMEEILAPIIRGIIPPDGSPGRTDLSLGEQLRQ